MGNKQNVRVNNYHIQNIQQVFRCTELVSMHCSRLMSYNKDLLTYLTYNKRILKKAHRSFVGDK